MEISLKVKEYIMGTTAHLTTGDKLVDENNRMWTVWRQDIGTCLLHLSPEKSIVGAATTYSPGKECFIRITDPNDARLYLEKSKPEPAPAPPCKDEDVHFICSRCGGRTLIERMKGLMESHVYRVHDRKNIYVDKTTVHYNDDNELLGYYCGDCGSFVGNEEDYLIDYLVRTEMLKEGKD